MDQEDHLKEIMREFTNHGVNVLNNVQSNPLSMNVYFEKYSRFIKDLQELFELLAKNPYTISAQQIAYWQDLFALMENSVKSWAEGKGNPIEDKRFKSENWRNNPFFNLLSQQYVLLNIHLTNLLHNLPFDDKKVSKRVKFLAQQVLDALSPDNFFLTNPDLHHEAINSHGHSLMLGWKNLLQDLGKGPDKLSIKMTDHQAFAVGKNIAATPGKVIYKNKLIELIQYTPQTKKVYAIPLLIIPPWINKYYVLDLSPHNSLVNYLVSNGITVFMISWVNPDASYRQYGLYEYLAEGPIKAIEIIKKQLSVKQLNLLGYCIGGTLLALLLGYFKAIKNHSIKSATFLASMIDFSDPGDIAVYIDEEQIRHLEHRMNEKGYLDGHLMANAFNSLRSSDLVWSFYIKNYLRGQNPVPFDILYWNSNNTNLPAKMHSEYLRSMYLNNDLIKPGKIKIKNKPIDVHHINIPTFFVSTLKDHIAPWHTSYIGYHLMKGKKQFILGESGHVNGIINPPSSKKYGYFTNSSTGYDSQKWFDKAQHHAGSWWPCWLQWLGKQSGKLVAKPEFKKIPYPGKYNSPGKYALF